MGGSLTHSGLENGYWGIMVVTYPFISGLVAGSFIVSSLSHVFHQRRFDALAPLAVLASLALLIAAPVTVLGDARQPSNALELLTRDHLPYSPLSMFIVIWLTYIALMLAELYFAFRVTNARIGEGRGWWARLHRVIALGSRDTSEPGARRDRKVLFGLSCAGIVLAFLFHGYIGFVFGATKARSLWATPLMPVLFIVSAIVSGIAFMWLVYVVVMRYVGRRADREVASGLLTYLMVFLLLDLFLDALDLLTSAVPEYAQGSTYYAFYHLMLHGPFTFTYLGVQLGIGMILPLVLWLVPVVRRSWLGGAVISLAVLVGVFAMRWNVVLGGQAESKVSSNTVVTTSVPLTGFDSVQTILGVFGVAFLLFLLFTWLFPWRYASEPTTSPPLPLGPSTPAGSPAAAAGEEPSLLPGAGLSSASNKGGA
ncbi:MAG: polysulfide reductase NrfD [Actinomycetota bacterium]|nr:polysulfide reductase NrfD [Actinomycetota bacterium]